MPQILDKMNLTPRVKALLRDGLKEHPPHKRDEVLTSMRIADLLSIPGIGYQTAKEIYIEISRIRRMARASSLEGQLIQKIKEANSIIHALDPSGKNIRITTEGGFVRLWRRV